MPYSWQKLAAGLLFGILLFNEAAGIATASSGGQVTLPPTPPTGKALNTSGLKISIDTIWLPTNGCRPVRVTINPVAPTTFDRTLQIRLTPVGQKFGPSSSVQVTRMIDIPAGSPGVTATIPVPQWDAWQSLGLEVFEGGRRIDELSTSDVLVKSEVQAGYYGPRSPALGRFPAVLLLGVSADVAYGMNSKAVFTNGPDIFGSFRTVEFLAAGATNRVGVYSLNGPNFTSLSDLPDQWLDYSGIDIVLSPIDRLSDLIKNHPSQWAAIRRMVATGGNLCVYGVGEHLQRLVELEDLLDLGPQASTTGDAATDPSNRDWKLPDPKPDMSNPPIADAASADWSTTPFASHALGRGQIVAIRADNIFSEEKFDWDWLFITMRENRWQWAARTGVVLAPIELGANASNFWQFLIPGVGLTPVLQFQILISLFVIAIGPVNYLLLRRWQRLNLLPITVGVSAALVTLALFAYAFVHDGLGVRVRARSFTELDQRRGEAVCWSRLSYYAGLSPSRGLTFSGDVAVYPLQYGTERPMNREPPPRAMEWVAAEPNSADPLPSQHYPSEWLPARVPTQFVTVRAHKTAARLKVILSGQNGSVSRIENRLGARIRQLLLTDSVGHAFSAEGVNNDESATVLEVESSAAHARITKLILENDLQFPVEAGGMWSQTKQASPTYSTNPNWNSSYGQVPPPVETDTVLERSLHHAVDLDPRSFVAIMESSSEVELGIPTAREESSLHVVVGKW